MKKLFLAASALALLSAPAFAGNANFGGWYGGINLGGVNHHSDTLDVEYYNNGASTALESFGGIVGLQAGHNWHSGLIVFGIEADANYIASADETQPGYSDYVISHDPEWLLTLRGRAGVASEDTMLYLTAGAALLQSNNHWSDDFPDYYAETDGFEFGFIYGFGVEHAVNSNSSFKVEVLQGTFGSETVPVVNDADYTQRFDNEITVVRAGYNWKFNM